MVNIKRANIKSAILREYFGINLETIIERNEKIETREENGEKIMINCEKNIYIMMNEVAVSIWEILKKPYSVNKIVESLQQEYNVDKKTCEETVVDFLEQLARFRCITIS